jgi:hypothetical protein
LDSGRGRASSSSRSSIRENAIVTPSNANLACSLPRAATSRMKPTDVYFMST